MTTTDQDPGPLPTGAVIVHAPDGTVRYDSGLYVDPGRPRGLYQKTALVRALRIDWPFEVVTLEGTMVAAAGDFLVGPGVGDEFWPVARAVFEASHERVGIQP